MKKMSIALEREIMQVVKSDYSGLLKVEYHSKNGVFKQAIKLDRNDCSPVLFMDNMPDLFPEMFACARPDAGKIVSAVYDMMRISVESVEAFKNAGGFEGIDDAYILENVFPALLPEKAAVDVFIPFMDMKIVFKVRLKEHPDATFTVNKTMMNGLTEAELFLASLKNVSKLSAPCLLRMPEIVSILPDGEMKVLTNTEKFYGAAAIIYGMDKIRDLAEKEGSDIVIIPSSVHECILLPYDESMPFELLNAMVNEVNTSEVKEEEILSDHVYMYDRKADRIITDTIYQEKMDIKNRKSA